MNINEYQKKMITLYKKHRPLTPKQAEILDWAMGIAGESGEVAEKIKHHIFSEEPLDKMSVAKELGDVLWYLSALASSFNVSLEEVMRLNEAKLFHRHKGGYSHKNSANRHAAETKFQDTPIFRQLKGQIANRMSYIFIGPDGSGKTSISKRVADELSLPYIKNSGVDANKAQKFEDLLKRCKFESVIMDRLHFPDNQIYSELQGQIIKSEDIIDPYEAIKMIHEAPVVFVFVMAMPEVLLKRLEIRGDEFIPVNLDFCRAMCRSYDNIKAFLHSYKIPFISIYTGENTTLAEAVQDFYEAREEFLQL